MKDATDALKLIRSVPRRGFHDRRWAERLVDIYAQMLGRRQHFAQAAYRDGEWACMLGRDGVNANGEVYHPGLADALRHTLREPVGQWCVFWQPVGGRLGADLHQKARAWIAEHYTGVPWIVDRPFAAANRMGVIAPFLRATRERRVVLVGPRHMDRLPRDVLTPAVHVEVPDATAWRVTDDIVAEISDAVQPDDLVLFCAGMASNLMVHRLWPMLQDTVTLLDIGAVLDPYCGVYSRSTHRNPEWRENVMMKGGGRG